MTQILAILAVWLHALATVAFIGHYLLLALIYLPVLMKDGPDVEAGSVLAEISKRSRLWLYLSLLVFFISGTYLTFVDENYLGLGDFGNLWAVLMLLKHLIILGMIAAGFWFNGILHIRSVLGSRSGSLQALDRFRRYVNGMAIAGIVVLLLTAAAQLQ